MRITLIEAQERLLNGQVVGVPTETVYGLAASLQHTSAIQKIFTLKGRPSNNPLIVHVADVKEVFSFLQETVADLDILARDFWPGPMTIVLPIKAQLVPGIARAQLPTAAFRIPAHPLALELLKQTGPLVMPSANLSGRPSATHPHHVEHDFGIDFPVLDGGVCHKGLESTILIHRHGKWEIIRQGALGQEKFNLSLGYTPFICDAFKENPVCPGQMYRHYAPQAILTLVNSFDSIFEGVIVGFSDRVYPSKCRLFSLGPLADPDLAASNIYSILRQLDVEGIKNAYVDVDFPKTGVLSTLLERLHKAAQG